MDSKGRVAGQCKVGAGTMSNSSCLWCWVPSGEMNRSVSEGSRDQILEGLGCEDE